MARRKRRIAVIGGGPKAVAIAAKAKCINEVLGPILDITIFERDEIGAAWTGKHGYTDGKQILCTPAERDLGFPYEAEIYGEEVADAMQSNFSWMAYCIATGTYAEWVSRGRRRPSHVEFAEYLKHAAEHAECRVVLGEVIELAEQNSRWVVRYTDKESRTVSAIRGFDAVVVTGPGQAAHRLTVPPHANAVFDGFSFWQCPNQALALAAGSAEAIVIAGGGGTAAAIAGWLSPRVSNKIVMVGNQGALFARVDTSFENLVFTSREVWTSLSFEDRKKFTDRLTRGAVWTAALQVLESARNVEYQPGTAKAVYLKSTGPEVAYEKSSAVGKTWRLPACVVIDATGFDTWWFTKLLPTQLQRKLRTSGAKLQDKMDASLALPLRGYPSLHAPTLSHVVSPAFNSLMALGGMSDAVLRPHVEAALR